MLSLLVCLQLSYGYDIYVTEQQYSLVPSTLATYSIGSDYLSTDSAEYELHGWVKVVKAPTAAAEFGGIETPTR